MTRPLDLTGQTFGRLTVLNMVFVGTRSRWKCRCVCGNEKVATTGNLRGGLTSSCGCIRRESSVAKAKALHVPPVSKWDAAALTKALGY